MTKKLSIKRASEISGMSEQFIRVGLQQGRLPFGFAVKMSGNVYRYYISPIKFTKYTGYEVPDEYTEDFI